MMHAAALKTVLLVKAIEESDRTGELLANADRVDATRTVARDVPHGADRMTGSELPSAVAHMLVARAELLRVRLEQRYPVLNTISNLGDGIPRFALIVLILAFVLGASLATLDGSRRINILAFPLLGLIAWNLFIYAILIAAWRRRQRSDVSPSGLHVPGFVARWTRSRVDALLKRSAHYNAPLASALKRFSADWSAVTLRLLEHRARRLFHLGAATVAVGMIVGLYVRGIALQYTAGWESTFLGAETVRMLIDVIYWPAAALSGIGLPSSTEAVEGLRWRDDTLGVNAAPWIHLIAWTAVLYVVVPRLFLALLASAKLWAAARRATAPASLMPYARAVLSSAGIHAQGEAVTVTPYAYDPPAASASGLDRLLRAAFDETARVELRNFIPYGEVDLFASRVAQEAGRMADLEVVLMGLGATPERENHGAVITALRDAIARGTVHPGLLVMIDEAVYAHRMTGDASFAARLDERRQAWREFVRDYGLASVSIDLSRITADGEIDPERVDEIRGAVWTRQAAKR